MPPMAQTPALGVPSAFGGHPAPAVTRAYDPFYLPPDKKLLFHGPPAPTPAQLAADARRRGEQAWREARDHADPSLRPVPPTTWTPVPLRKVPLVRPRYMPEDKPQAMHDGAARYESAIQDRALTAHG